jgi:hypothetical protein
LSLFYVINYDLKDIPLQDFAYNQPVGGDPAFYVAPLNLTLRLAPQKLNVKLHFKKHIIAVAELAETPTQADV